MLNKATLLGNVGKDPDVRSMQNGGKVANLSIATTERWKDKQTGEKREATEWHKVAAFGPLAGIVEQYVRSGRKIYVEGKIQTRKWEKDGTTQYTTEIVLNGPEAKLLLLSSKQDGQGNGGGSQPGPAGKQGGYEPGALDENDFS